MGFMNSSKNKLNKKKKKTGFINHAKLILLKIENTVVK